MAGEASTSETQNAGEAPDANTTGGTSSEQTQSGEDLAATVKQQAESIRKLEENNKRLADQDAQRRKAIEDAKAAHQQKLAELGDWEKVAASKDEDIAKIRDSFKDHDVYKAKAEAWDKHLADTEAQLSKDMKQLSREDRELVQDIEDPLKRARHVQRLLSKKTESGSSDTSTAAAGNGAPVNKPYEQMSKEEQDAYLSTLGSSRFQH